MCVTALVTTFRRSCMILEASTCRNDIAHGGSCLSGSLWVSHHADRLFEASTCMGMNATLAREEGIDFAGGHSPSMPRTSSSPMRAESLDVLSERLRIPAAVATVLSSIARVTCLVLATMSAHLSLSSRNRAKGDHLRSSVSVP